MYFRCDTKPQIFIVEGPDCSGKSTLCNILHQLYGGTLFHITYFKDQKDIDTQFMIVQNYLSAWLTNNKKMGTLIFDRFIGSNIVYSNVFKNTQHIRNQEEIYDYLNLIAKQDNPVMFINCQPYPKDRYLDNYVKQQKITGRKELYGMDVKGMEDVYTSYTWFWHVEEQRLNENIKVIPFDMFTEPMDKSLGDYVRDMKDEVEYHNTIGKVDLIKYWEHVFMKDRELEENQR